MPMEFSIKKAEKNSAFKKCRQDLKVKSIKMSVILAHQY